jgi:hypothetical protein
MRCPRRGCSPARQSERWQLTASTVETSSMSMKVLLASDEKHGGRSSPAAGGWHLRDPRCTVEVTADDRET